MHKPGLILLVLMGFAGCDASDPNRDLVSLDGEEAAYQPLPPLRIPPAGAPLPEPGYETDR